MTRSLLAILVAGGFALTACDHQPLDEAPPAPAGEFEEGPGLFSGADGGFYIVGGPDKKKRRYD